MSADTDQLIVALRRKYHNERVEHGERVDKWLAGISFADALALTDAFEASAAEVTRLWEALFWVSEWPNRHVGALTAADNEAVILAEYAREALR
jgi:hypothetical protein